MSSEQEWSMSSEINLGEVGRSVIRIERKLDTMADDHEKRLRQLERWMWGAIGTGTAGMVSGVAALVAGGVPS